MKSFQRTQKYNWIESFPQTELSKRLYGEQKTYLHHPFCSGDRRKPIGSSGCCCLNWLRKSCVNRGIYYD